MSLVYMPVNNNIVDMSDRSIDELVFNSPELPIGIQMDSDIGNYDGLNDYHYTYDGIEHIEQGEPDVKENDTLQLLTYRIVSSTVKPFLMFCLYRDERTLGLANMENKGGKAGKNAEVNMNSVFETWRGEVRYKGFIRDNRVVTLCLEYTEGDIQASQGRLDDRWWWVLATEIVNEKRVLTYDVSRNVVGLLERNPSMLFLRDECDRLHETPSVGYYGSYANRIAVTTVLGRQRAGPTEPYGPYYYFGNYEAAMRYAIWTKTLQPMEVDGELVTNDARGRYLRGGLVRFALFLGKTKVMLGRSFDGTDSSNMSKTLEKHNPLVAMTRKLRDVDANWIFDYNSVQTGEIAQVPFDMLDINNKGEVDIKDWKVCFGNETGFATYDENGNGKITEKEWQRGLVYTGIGNQSIVKEYNQQIPLEYYYVDTSQNNENLKEVEIE